MTRNSDRGMTLIETFVWIAIFISAMLALAGSVLYFYRSSNYAIEQAAATSSAQRGIDAMVRTIREAAYASNGAYPVISLAPNDIKFYADIDSSSAGIEEVHYYVQGTALVKGIIYPSGDPATYTGAEATSTVSDYVHNLDQGISLFTYYDKTGAQISDYTRIGDLRYVSAALLIDVDPNRSPTALTLRSSAALRNLVGK